MATKISKKQMAITQFIRISIKALHHQVSLFKAHHLHTPPLTITHGFSHIYDTHIYDTHIRTSTATPPFEAPLNAHV